MDIYSVNTTATQRYVGNGTSSSQSTTNDGLCLNTTPTVWSVQLDSTTPGTWNGISEWYYNNL
jgi:hypothetical protein